MQKHSILDGRISKRMRSLMYSYKASVAIINKIHKLVFLKPIITIHNVVLTFYIFQ